MTLAFLLYILQMELVLGISTGQKSKVIFSIPANT